jgi:ATP-dependent Zn protease
MVAPSPHTDDWQERHREMMANISVSQGSRVAELLIIGEAGNGHGGDGPAATHNAERVVNNGHTFTIDAEGNPQGRLSWNTTRKQDAFDDLVEGVLREAWADTWKLLDARQDQVEAVARLLVDHGTVSGDLIHRTLESMEAS